MRLGGGSRTPKDDDQRKQPREKSGHFNACGCSGWRIGLIPLERPDGGPGLGDANGGEQQLGPFIL
jgi:hypothetical protein